MQTQAAMCHGMDILVKKLGPFVFRTGDTSATTAPVTPAFTEDGVVHPLGDLNLFVVKRKGFDQVPESFSKQLL
eukprot:m.37953 g.37953  ORF g.37953 m.37953 type:complete len:74 (+) comp17796_c0_seq1:869-1090(+)